MPVTVYDLKLIVEEEEGSQQIGSASYLRVKQRKNVTTCVTTELGTDVDFSW